MSSSRRIFLQSLSRSAVVLSFENVLSLARPGRWFATGAPDALDAPQSAANATPTVSTAAARGVPGPPAELGVSFVNVAREAGLNARTIFGGEHKNKYLLETTGCGVAFYDYDNDGWLDIFLVNGERLEGLPAGQEPTSHLFKNNRDGTFTDVTMKAGVGHSGWGQGVCVGDYDNDGYEDLFITYFGKNVLYHNNGNGTFTDVSEKAGVAGNGKRWNTGCAFFDYDRDGHLDLFVANYIDMDLKTAPVPESGPCLYKGVMVACGPPGLIGGKNILYHNNGDGTFTDVSESSGILQANGTYGLGVLTADFDNDGWPDVYVANDSTASALYNNLKNGKFSDVATEAGCALSADGKPQAGMGVSAADYDLDGNLDILKTNFAGDTPSLYRNLGGGVFEDATFPAGLGKHTQYLGWGCGFFDMDNDGWPDILICNGHVYPEVEQLRTEAGYPQQKLLYRNLRDGRFEDVSARGGPGIVTPVAARGCAFGDFDNDGDIDVVVNTVNDFPQLLRCDSVTHGNWIKVRTIGVKSNRSGIGARLRCVTHPTDEKNPHAQIDEVRSGGSYISQNDLRVHFGIGKAEKVELLEVRWPSGVVDTLKDIKPNQVVYVQEGKGIVRTTQFDRVKLEKRLMPTRSLKWSRTLAAVLLAISFMAATTAAVLPFAWHRLSKSPILSPQGTGWESGGVFNPAVVYANGKYVMLYRAQDASGTSRLGYAESGDGVHFVRDREPVLSPETEYESGGGVEDPRLQRFDDTFYLTYTGYNKKDAQLCLATSRDLRHWHRLGVILPAYKGNWNVGWTKSGAIVPEKIDGKYWMYWLGTAADKTDQMGLSYSTDLVHWTEATAGPVLPKRPGKFDARVVEPGPAPIITSAGIVLIYNGADERLVYRTGVTVFDLRNPRKLVVRGNTPVLQPELDWEKDGQVRNVVFVEGMVRKGRKFVFYYGAADKYVGVAEADADGLLPVVR